jgi:hypothetical protein
LQRKGTVKVLVPKAIPVVAQTTRARPLAIAGTLRQDRFRGVQNLIQVVVRVGRVARAPRSSVVQVNLSHAPDHRQVILSSGKQAIARAEFTRVNIKVSARPYRQRLSKSAEAVLQPTGARIEVERRSKGQSQQEQIGPERITEVYW